MSQSRMAVITFLDGGPVDPGFGGGIGSQPGYPSQGLPGGGYPSHGLPISPGHPGNALPGFPGFPAHLPVYPFDPTVDNSLPGQGERPDQGLPPSPGRPDQGLPPSQGRPSQPIHEIRPGMRFMVKWLVCGGLILVPDNSLPGGEVDNTLPPTAQPKK